MGYITDEHRNAITLSAMERWRKGRFKRTIKKLTLFDILGGGGDQNVFNHCAQTLRKMKLKLGDF